MPPPNAPPRLICLLGAECTGKTSLAQALADHYGGLCVPEYLRQFCDVQQRTPALHEQRQIVLTQLRAQRQAWRLACQRGINWVFCDTSALTTAVYSAFYFADTRLLMRARALQRRYALTLLLSPDLPWVADGIQRDSRCIQTQVHTLMVQSLADMPGVMPIGGCGQARLQAAVAAVDAGDPT